MAETTLFPEAPRRQHSIDAFRALNMLCMIFINDLSGVKGIPYWMDHAKRVEDRMGFADTIFPAFLFIVGLSIPLAFDRKIKKGDSAVSISSGILSRSLALLVMGFFQVNLESFSSASLVSDAVWGILITLAFFLIWIDYPDAVNRGLRNFLREIGWITLIVMAFLYKGIDTHTGQIHGMEPEWWGILGIIGWSYLVCALIYYLVQGNFTGVIIAFLVFMGFNIIDHGLHLKLSIIGIYDGSSISLVLAGVVMSLWYRRMVSKGFNTKLWLLIFLAGCAAIAAGFLIRPYTEGISKIRATPAWIFICTGISILVFEIMIYLVDFKNKKSWFNLIWPAGTATLTCYLIPYFQVGFYNLFHFNYPHFLNYGWGGFFRSWAVAFVVVIIGGFLERKHLKLKV